MSRAEGNKLIRRAFELGFLEIDQPASHLEFRYRVWCEARRQPFVSVLRKGEVSLIEMDLARGPCQLTEETLEQLSSSLPYPFQELTLTRCLLEAPTAQASSVAVKLFETAWRLAHQ